MAYFPQLLPEPSAEDLGPAVVLINAGGLPYTDPSGNTWVRDEPYAPFGRTNVIYGSNIGNTELDPLYRSERYRPRRQGPLLFEIPVPATGVYHVLLHVAEIYPGITRSGQRVFDIEIEGQLAIEGYDTYAENGFLTAGVRAFTIPVTDGTLNLRLTAQVQNPHVCGVAVYTDASDAPFTAASASSNAVLTAAPTTTAGAGAKQEEEALLRINCGGLLATAADGTVWFEDRYFLTGAASVQKVSVVPLGRSDPPVLYHTRRSADAGSSRPLSYAVPLANGFYRVHLHFAETEAGVTAAGERAFSLHVEGGMVYKGIDVFDAVGRGVAMRVQVDALVEDGTLDISLVQDKATQATYGPMLSALSIRTLWVT